MLWLVFVMSLSFHSQNGCTKKNVAFERGLRLETYLIHPNKDNIGSFFIISIITFLNSK